jgi:hypothetical protein
MLLRTGRELVQEAIQWKLLQEKSA